MATWYVELGGVDVTDMVRPGSLTWTTKEGEELDTAQVMLDDRARSLGILRSWQTLELGTSENGALFAGPVTKLTPKADPTGQWLSWQIDAEGYETLVDKSPAVTKTYIGQTAGTIVGDLFDEAGLTPEFDATTYVETGPTINMFTARGDRLTSMLDQLAVQAKMNWYTDAAKQVHLVTDETVGETALISVISPGTLANHGLGVYEIEAGSLEVQIDARDITNRLTITGGYGPGAAITDTFAGSSKQGTAVGWAFNLSHQKIVTTPSVTLNGVSQTVGTAWVDYFGKNLPDGNGVDVIISRVNGVLYFDLETTIEDGDQISVTYQVDEEKSVLLDASSSVASAASLAYFGRYFDGKLAWQATDETEAAVMGEAYIEDHGFEVVSGSFSILNQFGLRAGQYIGITAALYGLSGSYPIRQVTNDLLTNMSLRSTVKFGGRTPKLSNALGGASSVVTGPFYGEATMMSLNGVFMIGDPTTEFVP